MTNTYCPLCGEENKCLKGRVEQGVRCWCDNEKFPVGIFELVPAESKNMHCICQKCVNKYREEEKMKK